MKKLILLGALLLTLTACSAPKEAAETPIPPPAQAASPSPAAAATPEPEPVDVVSETFYPQRVRTGQDHTAGRKGRILTSGLPTGTGHGPDKQGIL